LLAFVDFQRFTTNEQKKFWRLAVGSVFFWLAAP
jgi:hypothetical protein